MSRLNCSLATADTDCPPAKDSSSTKRIDSRKRIGTINAHLPCRIPASLCLIVRHTQLRHILHIQRPVKNSDLIQPAFPVGIIVTTTSKETLRDA